MDLDIYLKSNPDISLFDLAKDNERVLAMMAESPMKVGGIELLYDRRPSFKALLNCQSLKNDTFLGLDGEKNLIGFFSMSFAKKWIFGKKQQCGYIGDFRTNRSRKAAVLWRKVYSEILKLVQNEATYGFPKFFLTAILKKNTDALKNLTSLKKDLGFYYHKLADVDMVNVYGRFPWHTRTALKVCRAQGADFEALKIFLNRCESKKIFGSIFDSSEDDCWNHRSTNWPDFHLESFLLIKDQHNTILACTLPWNPDFAKRMTVQKAPFLLTTVFKILSLLGMNMPKVGESLKTIYLTHFNCDSMEPLKKEIVVAFLNHVLYENKNCHMVSFGDEHGIANQLQGFIMQKVPVSLFLVTTDREFKFPEGNRTGLGFEMGLV